MFGAWPISDAVLCRLVLAAASSQAGRRAAAAFSTSSTAWTAAPAVARRTQGSSVWHPLSSLSCFFFLSTAVVLASPSSCCYSRHCVQLLCMYVPLPACMFCTSTQVNFPSFQAFPPDRCLCASLYSLSAWLVQPISSRSSRHSSANTAASSRYARRGTGKLGYWVRDCKLGLVQGYAWPSDQETPGCCCNCTS